MATLNRKNREILWHYALGEPLTDQESRQFVSMMDESYEAKDELRRHFDFRDLMSATKEEAQDPTFVSDTMELIANLPWEPSTPTPPAPAPLAAFWAWIGSPAVRPQLAFFSVLAVLVVGYFAFVKPYSINVPQGSQETVVLADQSVVTLSSGSRLRVFPHYLRSVRKFHLDGEAFFEVEPGKKPFKVKTFNSLVTVTGTQFNVRARSRRPDRKTMVAVYEGMVDVESVHLPEQAVRLARGEGTDILDSIPTVLVKRDVAIEHVLSWKEGGFAFENETLQTVFDELELRYDLDLTAPRTLNNQRLTYFSAKPASIRDVLDAICESLELTYTRTAHGYEVLPVQ